jgi:hypothetical protein
MTGIERIAAERKRQIEEEGWTARPDFVRTCKYSINGICEKIDFFNPQSLSVHECHGNWFKLCCEPIVRKQHPRLAD